MPIPSPLHPRTSSLCTSLRWKDWAGYHAVCSFDTCHEREYFAFRHAAGLMDVTPLHKYDVAGPDAATFLARVMVRDVSRLEIGRVTYCCWCDEQGKLLDDGTVWRLDEEIFRVTAAEPNLAWLRRNASGYAVTVEDVTARVAALSLQGPASRVILKGVCDAKLDGLRFFRLTRTRIGAAEVVITRTGYSGDLGYELWMDNEHALAVWDTLMEAGRPHGLAPTGLDALDVCRIEAGFIMNGVDYFSANHCVIETRKSSPDEAGLGWTVDLEREPFNGQAAMRVERRRGPAWSFVGLEIDWEAYERLHMRYGLPPEISSAAWRTAVPVYAPGGRQVGQATSGAWSPLLKRNLALATVGSAYGATGQELLIETTVEYVRHRIPATVVRKPFFDVPRKRAVVTRGSGEA